MKRLLGVIVLGAVCSCGGQSDLAKAWVGTYNAVWTGTTTFTTPSGWQPATGSETGVITITETGSSSILMSWKVGSNPPSGTIGFSVNSTTATFNGTGSPFTGRLSNGSTETAACDICTGTLNGTSLTQVQTGHNSGVYNGVSWTGTYVGTWVGIRAP